MVAPSSLIRQMFDVPPPLQNKEHDRNIQQVHYCINLGESPIVSVVRENIGLKFLPRGVLFPIKPWTKFGDARGFADDPQTRLNGLGQELTQIHPGHVAAFLEREYGDSGIHCLWSSVGWSEDDLLRAAGLLDFSEPEWANKDLNFETVFEVAAKKDWQWNNPAIKERLSELRVEYAGKDKVVSSLISDLMTIITNIDNTQKQALFTAKNAISKEQLPCLDSRHHLMCRATGLSASDFEVSGDASRMANQSMLQGLSDMFQKNLAAMSTPVAPVQNEQMSQMLAMMQQQNEKMEALMKENQSLAGRLAKLEPKKT